jgi:hypothetical protein
LSEGIVVTVVGSGEAIEAIDEIVVGCGEGIVGFGTHFVKGP